MDLDHSSNWCGVWFWLAIAIGFGLSNVNLDLGLDLDLGLGLQLCFDLDLGFDLDLSLNLDLGFNSNLCSVALWGAPSGPQRQPKQLKAPFQLVAVALPHCCTNLKPIRRKKGN